MTNAHNKADSTCGERGVKPMLQPAGDLKHS